MCLDKAGEQEVWEVDARTKVPSGVAQKVRQVRVGAHRHSWTLARRVLSILH